MDSGASNHFTLYLSDYSSYEELTEAMTVQTASKTEVITKRGKGTVFIRHFVIEDGKIKKRLMRLHPVYYIPEIVHQLLSMGEFLRKDLVTGDADALHIVTREGKTVISCERLFNEDMIF